MTTFQAPCPVCSGELTCQTSGWFRAVLKEPKFCGHCGGELIHSCPDCGKALTKLYRNCSGCGSNLYARNAAVQPSLATMSGVASPTFAPQSPTQAQERALKSLATAVEDANAMQAEVMRTLLRLNPINITVIDVTAALEPLTEDTDDDTRVQLITEAIGRIDLDTMVEDFKASENAVYGFAYEMLIQVETELVRVMPDYACRMTDIPDFGGAASAFSERIKHAVDSQDYLLEEFGRRYSQLVEHLPRYQDLMTNTGWLKMAGYFAAGFFGGDIGVLGAELWDGWSNSSDEQFVDKFFKAFVSLLEMGEEYTDTLLTACKPVIRQGCDEYMELESWADQQFRALAIRGVAIEGPIEQLCHPDIEHDEDSRAFLEVVLDNMREDGMSSRREKRLRAVAGL